MARRSKKPGKPADVENYRHDSARRRMIPTAEQQGFVQEDEAQPIKLQYPRNTDLDPQLMWRGKDAENEADLYVDAPPVYIQEKIHPRQIVERLKADTAKRREQDADIPDLFADFNGRPEDREAHTEFYAHDQNWQNRMILGDALMVMASLAEREGLRGKVQCIYMDPPYGIKFNSNWQTSTNSRDVRDGNVAYVSREPEVVRAFRDTWKDGVNTYLSYLRDRLSIARDLLNESGAIFVQIGDENVHLVRTLMDEIFGEKNFVSQIAFKKTTSQTSALISGALDYIISYAKKIESAKYRQIYLKKALGGVGTGEYQYAEDAYGVRRRLTADEYSGDIEVGEGEEIFASDNLTSQKPPGNFVVEFRGRKLGPGAGYWKTGEAQFPRLLRASRVIPTKSSLKYKRLLSDFPVMAVSNYWDDVSSGASSLDPKVYVVQTTSRVVERCLLMASDPGDLVLDPTCGSGTTAYVAEQWGRRWITVDTSRVALALARARIMGARYPYYLLSDSEEGARKENDLLPDHQRRPVQGSFSRELRQGFVYERASHITLKSIANNAEIDEIWERWQETLELLREQLNKTLCKGWEEWEIPREADKAWDKNIRDLHAAWWQERRERQAEIDASIARNADVELLYDRPYTNNRVVRVAGPFTVESLSPHRVIPAAEDPRLLAALENDEGELPHRLIPPEETDFAQVVYEHLKAAGVQNTKKGERIEFESLTPWAGRGYVCYEGRYERAGKTVRAAIAIGPEYDAVGYEFVRAAAREARDAFDELIICGFQFAPEVDDTMLNFGRLTVLKARMNQDIRMGDRLKNTGAGNLFVVFGEPDIEVRELDGDQIEVEIKGVDIFDPTTGEVKCSDDPAEDIACWFIDDDYNEESFFVRQAYFLGGAAGDPYKALKRALKAEVDEEAWATLHTTVSRPFPRPETGRICIKVINHFGDEVQKVFDV